MRQFDTLSSMLENSSSLYSQCLYDPIFATIFTTMFAQIGLGTVAASTAGAITAAIATTALPNSAYFGSRP